MNSQQNSFQRKKIIVLLLMQEVIIWFCCCCNKRWMFVRSLKEVVLKIGSMTGLVEFLFFLLGMVKIIKNKSVNKWNHVDQKKLAQAFNSIDSTIDCDTWAQWHHYQITLREMLENALINKRHTLSIVDHWRKKVVCNSFVFSSKW